MTQANEKSENEGLKVTEKKFVLSPLQRLSKASNVQEIVASQLELMIEYHGIVLNQARASFKWALITAFIGFLFFIISIIVILIQGTQGAAMPAIIGGALSEFISGINFYLYRKAAEQLADFQNRLDNTQRYVVASNICDNMEGELKQQMRSELIRIITNNQLVLPSSVPATGTQNKKG